MRRSLMNHAIVIPRLTKSTWDPDNLKSNQPISNHLSVKKNHRGGCGNTFQWARRRTQLAAATLVCLSCSPIHWEGRYRRTQSSGSKRWSWWSRQCSGPLRSEQCLRHRRSRDHTWCAGKTFRQMVPLIPQWTNVDLPSGITEHMNVVI